jgi:hypothetical protein
LRPKVQLRTGWKLSFSPLLKSPMVIGLVTLDKDHTLTLRLSKEKCAAVAEIIGENFKKYPRIAFGKARWAQYFGDVGEEPPLPHNIKEILNAPCPIWPNKKVHETHLLTLIPKTVDGEYLTLKALGELVQKPLEGLPSAFAWRDLGEYQDTLPKHSYWILSSRDVIPDSRNKTFANQKKLLDKYPGYEILRIMDIAVALFMEHVRYGSRLYSDEPWTFTRCQEQYNVDCPLVVGDFGLRGLNMSHNYNGDDKNCGIGIFRSL